jgi:GxxExxY protein
MRSWARALKLIKKWAAGFWNLFTKSVSASSLSCWAFPFASKLNCPLTYKRRPLKKIFQPDFICYDQVVVAIKATSNLTEVHRAQVHNYLKATGYRLGILVNFNNHPQLEWERIVR